MWGQGPLRKSRVVSAGIIPTRVGTSHTKRIVTAVLQDHPHACGDKCDMRFLQAFALGSSPRVWGQAALLLDESSPIGIIPTRVGTSKSKLSCIVAKKDHPHACGDKGNVRYSSTSTTGSSPRVWGQGQHRL